MYNLININENKKFYNFVQLSGTRWLARYEVIKRLLDNWSELKTFFEMASSIEKCYTARVINSMLHDKKNEIYFIFLKLTLFEMNRLNLLLQNDTCDVGSAYCDMFLVIQSLSRRIIKPLF